MKKCILKSPGAKNKISDWIVSFIPEHQVYLEPFAGSLAILFNKPKAPVETVNDLDDVFEQKRMILISKYHWKRQEIYDVMCGYLEIEV